MSTNIDVVENALTDEPQNRKAIAEATGLEVAAISPCLTALHNAGRAARTAGGWVRGEGSIEPVRKVHVAAPRPEEPEKPATRRKGRKRKAEVSVLLDCARNAAGTGGAPRNAAKRALEFALTESNEILVRPAGDRIGWSPFPIADARALAELVERIPS